jgi:hypothetical protein
MVCKNTHGNWIVEHHELKSTLRDKWSNQVQIWGVCGCFLWNMANWFTIKVVYMWKKCTLSINANYSTVKTSRSSTVIYHDLIPCAMHTQL